MIIMKIIKNVPNSNFISVYLLAIRNFENQSTLELLYHFFYSKSIDYIAQKVMETVFFREKKENELTE